MAFVFNFYQYGGADNTPPRPRPKTAARPLPALLPPGDWSEPIRRRRRDDPTNAGGRRGRSHSPSRRNSRSPRQMAPPSPHRSRSGSGPRPKTPSPSVPPGNFNPSGNFQAPGPAFFRGPQVFVPPQAHEPSRAPMAPGHPWPPPPMWQFRPRPEPVHQAPPAPRPMQTPAPGPARDARPAQNKGPRRPAVPKTPPQQKTADELLDNLLKSHEEERRGQAASSSARFNDVSDTAPNPAEVEEVFEAVYEASTLELERQLGIVDACNTFSGENPLTGLHGFRFALSILVDPQTC